MWVTKCPIAKILQKFGREKIKINREINKLF